MADAPLLARRSQRSGLLKPFRVLRARPRLLICALIGVAIGVVLPEHMRVATRALIAWNIAVIAYLSASAVLIAGADHQKVRQRAQFMDEGRFVILLLAIGVACASMGAIVLELGPVKNMEGLQKALHLGLAVLTVIDSWMFLHLTFAFHYAHEYYDETIAAPDKKPDERGGLMFPGGEMPNYVDFLYYSFVIGLASQTADVSTSSREMRVLTAVHGTLSFFYNLAIIGLTVNIASGVI
ncbi:MAG TPA: DUF1345 domain-containing protein [Methylocystis sp.]|nr:DUF1345 domain-containing protein [Methylocystis sp.]